MNSIEMLKMFLNIAGCNLLAWGITWESKSFPRFMAALVGITFLITKLEIVIEASRP